MPGQRHPDQDLLGFWAKKSLVEKIDKCRGFTQRSDFLREAVAEYLRAKGLQVPTEEIRSPDRAGKGGPRLRKPAENSAPSPANTAAPKLLKKMEELEKKAKRSLERQKAREDQASSN